MDDLQAHYDVGEPMTFEQMRNVKAREREMPLYDPFDGTSGEKNPYLFEDEPVGSRRFVVASIVVEHFGQKHGDGKCMMKLKVSTASVEHAKRMCDSIAEKDPRYALYVLEMFKFICLPPPSASDCDAEMNEAMRLEYSAVEESHKQFLERKQTMLDEVQRHNDIARRIADGELEESDAQSAPVLPEAVSEAPCTSDSSRSLIADDMEPDAPLCGDSFVVVATLTVRKYEKLMNHLIVKICGTFPSEADATAHMKELKKDMRYKLFDVTVCDMYAWLEMPPPYELIDNVLFDSRDLTDCLGTRKKTINVHSSDLQVPADV